MEPYKIFISGKYIQREELPNGSLPSGRIFKKFTGIGATTIEIKDETRNSIIVCPTRALAATKAKKHNIFYIGSQYEDVPVATSEQIAEALNSDEVVKVMAVADSFIGLRKELGEDINKFFVMYDEIDSFQSDSNYRPNLEICLDIYFSLDQDKRAMVSATLQESADPEIESEPKTEIDREDYKKEKLILGYCTNSPIITAKLVIQQYFDERNKDEKIIVAFNTIKGILKLIAALPEDLQRETGILCSERSHEDIKEKSYITYLKKSKLEKSITFITSAYFVGIDIEEKSRTIIVTDTSYKFSLLTKAKIFQIFGRSRKGCSKRVFLFNTKPTWVKIFTKYRNSLEWYAKVSKDTWAKEYKGKQNLNIYQVDLIQKSVEQVKEGDVSLLRLEDDEIKINRLNIDYLLHRQNSINMIYNTSGTAKETMSDIFDVELKTSNMTWSDEEKEKLGLKKPSLQSRKEQTFKLLQDKLNLAATKPQDQFQVTLIQILQRIYGKKEEKQVKNELEKLVENYSTKQLKRYWKQIQINLLPKDHPVWKAVFNYFQVGDRDLSGKIEKGVPEIAQVIKATPNLNLELEADTPTKRSSALKLFFYVDYTTTNDSKKVKIIKDYAGVEFRK